MHVCVCVCVHVCIMLLMLNGKRKAVYKYVCVCVCVCVCVMLLTPNGKRKDGYKWRDTHVPGEKVSIIKMTILFKLINRININSISKQVISQKSTKIDNKIYMEMQITQKSQNYLITEQSITISNLNTKLLYQNSTGMV